jgi:hypothetical protein
MLMVTSAPPFRTFYRSHFSVVHLRREDPLVRYEFEEIKASIEFDRTVAANVGWLSLFKTVGNRKRMRIIIAIAFFSQWSGNGLVSYYLNQVFNTIGITDPTTQVSPDTVCRESSSMTLSRHTASHQWHSTNMESLLGAFSSNAGRQTWPSSSVHYFCRRHVGILLPADYLFSSVCHSWNHYGCPRRDCLHLLVLRILRVSSFYSLLLWDITLISDIQTTVLHSRR